MQRLMVFWAVLFIAAADGRAQDLHFPVNLVKVPSTEVDLYIDTQNMQTMPPNIRGAYFVVHVGYGVGAFYWMNCDTGMDMATGNVTVLSSSGDVVKPILEPHWRAVSSGSPAEQAMYLKLCGRSAAATIASVPQRRADPPMPKIAGSNHKLTALNDTLWVDDLSRRGGPQDSTHTALFVTNEDGEFIVSVYAVQCAMSQFKILDKYPLNEENHKLLHGPQGWHAETVGSVEVVQDICYP